MRLKFFSLWALACLLSLPAAHAQSYQDDDRIAGRHVRHRDVDEVQRNDESAGETDNDADNEAEDSDQAPERRVERVARPRAAVQNSDRPAPVVHSAPIRQVADNNGGSALASVESFGTLKTPHDGSLGVDLWDGSDRATITGLIQQLPDAYSFRTIRSVVRRALATNADVTMLSHNAADGSDLLSLRMQKLMAMGALDDAAGLYKDNPADIRSSQIADTGLLAILYSNHSALACLETKARLDHFSSLPLWQEMSGLCDYLLQKDAGQATGGRSVQNASPLINKIVSDGHFRYAFKASDFEKLTPLEQGMLVADRRIDYSDVKKSDIAGFAPSTIALLARDTSAPGALRFELMLAAARAGIVSATELDAFYQAQNFPVLAGSNEQVANIKNYQGWQKIAWLGKSTDVAHGQIDKAALQAALPLRTELGLTALWPFASLMATANPVGFSTEEIRTGMLLGLVTDSPIAKSWVNQWKKNESAEKIDFLIQAAYEIQTNSSLDGAAPNANFLNQLKGLPQGQQETVKILYEKLDKHSSLHNSNVSKVYENVTDLTPDGTYVIPSKGLINSLEEAGTDKRLGEVILLSAVALHGTSPAHLPPDLLVEVVKEYETVGLTKEIREFAMEAILGLGQ